MSIPYLPPRQSRAKTTEHKFLETLDGLLHEKSLGLLTIDQIADKACLTRSAFLKRFGSKKMAILILYSRFCKKFLKAIEEITASLLNFESDEAACLCISKRIEALQLEDFAANRAIHELFMEELENTDETTALLKMCMELMKHLQSHHLPRGTGTEAGAYAATQLVFSINLNYVMKTMPGLPRDSEVRHQLIASLMVKALRL
jgi:AcrR family transcriptional regulator